MEWAEKTFPDSLKVVKVNCTDGNKELMEKYKVYGLPCLIVFKGGAQVDGSFKEGAITRKDLVKYLEKNVGLQVPA
jgi:thioredoxin 1